MKNFGFGQRTVVPCGNLSPGFVTSGLIAEDQDYSLRTPTLVSYLHLFNLENPTDRVY